MKILRVKIPKQRFRGLHEDFEIHFPTESKKKVDTLYLTGQNGSGKSNLLELISEIFYYLDSLELKNRSKSLGKEKDFSFEIEYKIQSYAFEVGNGFSLSDFIVKENKAPWLHVKIIKQRQLNPIYILKYPSGKDFTIKFNDYEETTVENIKNIILPKKIIGYTSGQNELLSNAFLRMRYHYFNEYEKIQKLRKNDSKYTTDTLSRSRLMLLDYRNNASIFIASLLFDHSNLSKVLKQTYLKLLGIKDLYSFRINIKFRALSHSEYPEAIQLSIKLNNFIEDLKRCTPFYLDNDNELGEEEKYKREVVLDFFVTEAIKDAFSTIFPDSKTLFEFFYEMEILNIYAQDVFIRESVLNASKDYNVKDKIASLDSQNLIFDISMVNILKTDFNYPIKYKNLSDGEHQFIQVIGALSIMKDDNCLFLLDEPATHLNPAWAIQYYKHIKNCRSAYDSSQIFLTTHDPLMVGPLRKEQVKIFKKENQNVNTFSPLDSPQGMGVSGLLKSDIFGLSSIVDIETTNKIQKRNELFAKKQLLKREGKDLSENENNKLTKLSAELSRLGFAIDFKDPFYAQYIERMAIRVKFNKPQLSKEEQQEQDRIADEIIDDLLSEVSE